MGVGLDARQRTPEKHELAFGMRRSDPKGYIAADGHREPTRQSRLYAQDLATRREGGARFERACEMDNQVHGRTLQNQEVAGEQNAGLAYVLGSCRDPSVANLKGDWHVQGITHALAGLGGGEHSMPYRLNVHRAQVS